ncbi:MAG: membrane protein insertase YidC, partial [Rhodospirillaceae bacterium]|nr:membrane protein insertase YidC [Rhodospirillaceae bacterium]
MNDQRNLFLAIAISVAIMIGWQYFVPAKPPVPVATEQAAAQAGTETKPSPVNATAPQIPGTPATAVTAESRAAALDKSRRITIRTPSVHGSIALLGARIDDLTLVKYHETPDPKSDEINLLSPAGSPDPYWAEIGWRPAESSIKVPDTETIWTPQTAGPLTPESPLVLTWDNGDGLRFVRTYAIDADYMFTIGQRVENYGAKPVSLHPYALLSRTGIPKVAGMYILHEGPLGYFGRDYHDIKYDDLQKNGTVGYAAEEGWIGFTDKYWLAALVPPAKTKVNGRFVHQRMSNAE